VSLGALVANEIVLPISRIYLQSGEVRIEAEVRGPVDLADDSEVRIHDPEGGLVAITSWRVPRHHRRDMRSADPDHTVIVTLPLRLTDTKWPERDGRS
jgi:hypothetical protein